MDTDNLTQTLKSPERLHVMSGEDSKKNDISKGGPGSKNTDFCS